ncbi:hypothetical protein E4U17_006965 [Claviceps sp. LM77 group G4]|nr:hypothetical protein E4U17_006965 [Claviceps sp. LM77 group G4]KAG6080342.1 hypothetical protein E4U16_000403 [Claviceps sp. LM84 group G4]KAG6081854.1 hypothetical protein E4U33_006368 [Claviceps sp. LM78 group G4]
MVKILSIFLAAFAASNVADAGTCTPGLKYCGKTLVSYAGFAMVAYHCTNVVPFGAAIGAPAIATPVET